MDEMRLRSGINWELEIAADLFLRDAKKASSANMTYPDLTANQLRMRQWKEVTNTSGVADATLMRGMFHRVYSPTFGKRPGSGAPGEWSD